MGIPIFAPYIEKKPIVFSKDFYIQYFDLPHDGTENYGFLIYWNGQRILYMTDFEYCKYKFKNINHIIIECNYQEKYIDAEAMNFEHKVKGHASLNTCKEFIRENASKSLRTAVIVHLSDKTCVPKEIVEEIKTVARFDNTVCCAVPGSDVELKETDCPF